MDAAFHEIVSTPHPIPDRRRIAGGGSDFPDQKRCLHIDPDLQGPSGSVMFALAVGVLVTLLQQAYIVDVLGLPESWKGLAFSCKLCIGTAIAFLVCIAGNNQLGQRTIG